MSYKTSSSTAINNRPVIGILTNALSNWLGNDIALDSKRAKSYLPAAYVNWIENSGARVVPIQYTATKPVIFSYLAQINRIQHQYTQLIHRPFYIILLVHIFLNNMLHILQK